MNGVAIIVQKLKSKVFIGGSTFLKSRCISLKNSRSQTLINQSLSWQHQLCKNPKANPDIKTLFVDHTCGQPNGARAPSPVTNPLMGTVPKAGGFPPLSAHGVSKTRKELFDAIWIWTVLNLQFLDVWLGMCIFKAISACTSSSSNISCWMDGKSISCTSSLSFCRAHGLGYCQQCRYLLFNLLLSQLVWSFIFVLLFFDKQARKYYK